MCIEIVYIIIDLLGSNGEYPDDVKCRATCLLKNQSKYSYWD